MPDFSSLLPIISLTITILVAIGLVITYLGNKNKGLSEVQNSTITALQAQNDAQEKQIAVLEKKILRLDRTIITIQYALQKRRRLRLEINEDAITIIDERTSAEVTVPVRLTGPLETQEKEK